MYKSSVDPLEIDFTMTGTLYVSVHLGASHEIMPIEVSFEDVLYDVIKLRTAEPINRGKELIISLYNEEMIYNITGYVLRSAKENTLYKTVIRIEELPTKLFNELIGMMKTVDTEVNHK